MNELERQPHFEAGPEIMKLPEISVAEENGEILLSVLFKGYDPSWGGHEHALVAEVENFFEQHPLDEKTIKFLQGLKESKDDSANEEMLYEIALTLDNPERMDAVVEFVSKYKFLTRNLQELQEELLVELRNLEALLPDDLKNKFKLAIQDDVEKRNQNMEATKKQIANLIDFFRPSPKTTKIKKIVILPTDFLYHEESGTAFEFGDTTILRSHIDNPGNLEHEFLHSVINPIVEKLSEKLTEEQKQKISNLGSYRLRMEEEYGDGYESLLCEELIRTYNDVIQKGEKPLSYDDFVQKINTIDDVQFLEILQKDEKLKSRCAQLGIITLEDMKNKSKEYYTRFSEGELRGIVYKFYQKYIQEKEKNNKITFEDFALKEFHKEF